MKKLWLLVLVVIAAIIYFSSTSQVDEIAQELLPVCGGNSECEQAVIAHGEFCNEAFWQPMFEEHERMLEQYGRTAEFEEKYGAYSREYSAGFASEVLQCISDQSGYRFP